MRLARFLQFGSFFISIAFKALFVWLILLSVFREASPRHVKGLSETHAESTPDMVTVNWSTSATAISNLKFSSWDPANASIKSATTQSSPKINTFAIRRVKKNAFRKKRSEKSSNSPITIESSEQPQVSTEINSLRQLPTSTKSSIFVNSSLTFAYLTPTQSDHHIRLRTSTATTLTTKEINAANNLTTSDHLINKNGSTISKTFAAVTQGYSEISTSVIEDNERTLITNDSVSTVTIPNSVNDYNETSLESTRHDSFTEFYDEVFNVTNTTEQLQSNSVFDVTKEIVVSTTEYQKNSWLPPLSSNSADSIALNPTAEGVNGGKDLLGIGAIAGIIMGVLLVVILVAGIFGFLIYRKRLRPLTDVKYPTDNCGYVDDTLRVSYMNNHIELPKENSEEMFSLDNDSFLNSLEAMTLQNYWAEDAKNTKV